MSPLKQRDLFVGDLHGMFHLLEALLSRIGFTPGSDRLWCVGDFVDRGTDPLGCVRFFRDTAGCGAVLGNHDAQFLSWWRNPQSTLTCQWKTQYGNVWLKRYGDSELAEIADYLSMLPLSREVLLSDGRVAGLVHAQQPPTVPFGTRLDWGVPEAFDEHGASQPGYSLWSRDAALIAKKVLRAVRHQRNDQKGRPAPDNIHKPPAPNFDPVDDRVAIGISGHTPFRDPPEPVLLGNHLFLDTMAFDQSGRLTIVDPVARRVWQLPHSGPESSHEARLDVIEMPLPAAILPGN